MYQRCPVCKSKGILKNNEQCPTCQGERIIHKENGLPPSRQLSYIPTYPIYPVYPHYPWWYTVPTTSLQEGVSTVGEQDWSSCTGTTVILDNSYNAICTATVN